MKFISQKDEESISTPTMEQVSEKQEKNVQAEYDEEYEIYLDNSKYEKYSEY